MSKYYVQCSSFVETNSPGMDFSSEQQGSEQFHYLMNEQAKSLAALHELQNEVGALLEFRDLVIETFPHLRTKMASQPSSSGAISSPNTTPNSSNAGMSHIPIPMSRREWEPGIKVRRKLGNKEHEASSLTLSRSRSNSQGSKYQGTQLLSGNANGSSTSSAGSSAVQDSGFGTESKEHYSASSSASNRGSAGSVASAEDELWNLLDVIHRKGSRLRQEVEHLQIRLQDKETLSNERERDRGRARSLGCVSTTEVTRDRRHSSQPREKISRSFDKCYIDPGEDYLENGDDDSRDSTDFRTQRLLELGREEVRGLRRERDLLLDRLAEMEAEMLASRAKTSHLKSELGVLTSAKRELEEKLQSVLTQRGEINSRNRDLRLQVVQTSEPLNSHILVVPTVKPATASAFTAHMSPSRSSQTIKPSRPSHFIPVPPKISASPHDKKHISKSSANNIPSLPITFQTVENMQINSYGSDSVDTSECEVVGGSNSSPMKLGALDGIISAPAEIPNYVKGLAPDRSKIAVVLQEKNPIELQRHLLTSMVENSALRLKTESDQKLKEGLTHQLDCAKEENDDLRFQLEERNIELEGTRARVRVLESMQQVRYAAEAENSGSQRPLLAGVLPDEQAAQQHSSSTESAHDADGQRAPASTPTTVPEPRTPKIPMSPRRRPSRIPLVKSYCAPKPPTSKSSNDTLSNSTGTSIGSTGIDTLKRRTAGSSPASRTTPDVNTPSWRQHRRDSSPSFGPNARSRDSLNSTGAGRSSSASVHHGSRESLGGPRSRSTPSTGKNQSSVSSSSLSRRELAKSRDSVHSSPGGRKIGGGQLRRNSVNTSLSRTNGGSETDQGKTRTTRLFSWGNWFKMGILDSPS